MEDIIIVVKQAFSDYGGIELYTSYDAIPVKDKGDFFTVVSVTKYETSDPIFSDTNIYLPVKAEVTLTLLAPQGSTANELYKYYDKYLEQAVNTLTGMKSGLKNTSVAVDTVSKRLALTAVLQIDAIKYLSKPAN